MKRKQKKKEKRLKNLLYPPDFTEYIFPRKIIKSIKDSPDGTCIVKAQNNIGYGHVKDNVPSLIEMITEQTDSELKEINFIDDEISVEVLAEKKGDCDERPYD